MLPLSSIVTTSNALATLSMPRDLLPSTLPNTPAQSRLNSISLGQSPSYDQLKKLTELSQKSHPATPTRHLSNQSHQTAKSDTSGSDRANSQNGKSNTSDATVTPHTPAAPGTTEPIGTTKGKLTVKIVEARGLRKSKDPYVVAVFQRNELVSGSPRTDDAEEDAENAMPIPMGGVPISRSGSDTGRSMAIPMKSRQSSNTSLTDYRDFRKTRSSMTTSPKWDSEAVL